MLVPLLLVLLAPPDIPVPTVRPPAPISLRQREPVWIVGPEVHQAAASRLAEALAGRLGSAPEIHRPEEVTGDERRRTLFVLGNLMTNSLAAELYRQRQVISDAARPGEAGYEVRTVFDPWGLGANVVFAGGSDPAGVDRAVERLLALLPEGETVPRLHEVRLRGQEPQRTSPSKAALAAIAKLPFREAGGAAQGAGLAIFLHDDPGAYPTFLAAMARLESFARQRDEIGDLRSMVYLPGVWDAIEGGFSLEQRQTVTATLLELARKMAWAAEPVVFEGLPSGNHWDARAADNFATYFRRRYDLEIGQLGANVDAFFAHQAGGWKCREDCPGYGSITYWDLLHHLLLTGNEGWLDSGRLYQAADYLLQITDNRGASAGFGDTGATEGGYYRENLLNAAAWFSGDGRYRVFSGRAEPRAGAENLGNVFETGLEPRVPEDLVGVAVSPVDDWIWNLAEEDLGTVTPSRELLAAKPRPERGQAFDKISFRPGFAPNDAYLLLGGINHGYHAHPDGGTIIQYSDRGQLWLFDHGYFVPDPAEHNRLVILQDGLAEPIPRFAAVTARADFGTQAIVRTTVRDYNGADWHRTVLWQKPNTFQVIDEIVSATGGTVGAQCVWRVMGEVESDDAAGRFIARQGTAAFQFTSATPAIWKWLATQPEAEDRHSLRQVRSERVEAGGGLAFVNGFTCRDDGAPGPALIRVAESVARWDDERLVGTGRYAAGELLIDAVAYSLTPQELAIVGLRELRLGDLELAADEVDVGWSDGRLALPNGGAVRLAGEPREGGELALSAAARAALQAAVSAPAARPEASPEAAAGAGWQVVRQAVETRVRERLVHRDAAGRELPNLARLGEATFWEEGSQGSSAAAAVDDDFESYMAVSSQAANANQVPKDLGVIWGEPRRVGEVVVTYHSPGYEPTVAGQRLEIWRDEEWQPLEVTPELRDKVVWVYRFEPVETARLRLVVTQFTTYRTAIRSFEIYEAAGETATETGTVPRETVTLVPVEFEPGVTTPVLVLTDGLVAYGPEGAKRFEVPLASRVHAAAAFRVGDAQRLAVGVGRELVAYDGAGEELWRVPSPPDAYTEDIAATPGDLNQLAPADLDGDGDDEIAAASTNWFAYAFDSSGKLIWRALNWAHPSNDIAVGDLTGDGVPELAYATRYNDANVFDAAGTLVRRVAGGYHSSPQRALIADFGAGPQVATGTRTGTLVVQPGGDGPSYRREFGARVTALAPLPTGERKLLVVGSENFHLYGFEPDGLMRWLTMVGDVPRAILPHGDSLLVLLDGGELREMDADGGTGRRWTAPGPGHALAAAGDRIWVATRDGQLVTLASH